MKSGENDKWLDKVLGQAFGGKSPRPDFQKWQQNHGREVEMLTSRAGGTGAASQGPFSRGARIMKSRAGQLAAAAAVIIAATVVGVAVFSGSDREPGEVSVPTGNVSGEVVEGSDSPVDIELKQVRQMYAAGDVKGLAGMLAQGRFESQVLAANYLAQMDNGAEAIGALEKVEAEYGKDEPGNPFTPAVQVLRNSAATASSRGSPSAAAVAEQPLAARGPDQVPQTAVVVSPREEPPGPRHGVSTDVSEEPQDAIGEGSFEIKGPLEIMVKDTRIGPELVDGIAGRAYYFDGVGDYIDCGSLGSFPSRGTIALWMVADEIANYRNPFTTDFAGSNAGVRFEEDGNGRFAVVIGSSESPTHPGVHDYLSSGLRANTWYNVVLVWDSDSDRVRGYIDGADKFDESQIEWPSTLADVQIGRGYSASPSRHWNGSIDEVAIFNRALSAEEIRQLYQNPGSLRGTEAGLVGYWSFDSDKGAVVKDSSPYHNDGLLCGLDTRPELTDGASGKGYYFDGDGDYIEIPPIEGLGTEQTKMLWIYPEVWPMPGDAYVLDEGGHQSNNNWIELADSDGNGVPNIRAGFDGENLFDSDGEIEAGYWCHIAVVSTSAGDVFTYINGVFDSSHSGFSTSAQPEGIVIGADGQSRSACFKGLIDEVAIFNRALSDDEIWRIYKNSGRLRGNEAGLVGYWNFDRDDGDVVRDMGPYGNNGKLGGM